MPTLEQLSGERWPDPEPDATPLVKKCARYVRADLDSISDEGIRLLVGQRIYLKHLLPVALERLDQNPWLSGDFYQGDLLKAVVGSSNDKDADNFRIQIKDVARKALQLKIPEHTPDDVVSAIKQLLKETH
ncbi:MAG: contact-dependent growth inhibition system immunity protein [Hyphomonas sp.]|uniref:contact-dependent growth inhibition system immunity protein n=1 Tax=Hyphomonas sp. TaxID=87 RepID=UPI0035288160